MVRAGDRLNLSPIGAIFRVIKTGDDTHGSALEMEWELATMAAGTPVHIHPTATESYQVLEGSLDVEIDGEWRTIAAGEGMSVPPGVPHTFRNSADVISRVHNTHAPAMRFAEYFEEIHNIVVSGAIATDRMTPKAMLYLATVMVRFKEEIISVNPPNFVVVLSAGLARILGYDTRSI
jgi:mannose-6-phosphate isomerase-like protein (cupin superfamily)